MHDPYKALYIHIPFCKRRCRYCDFTSQAAPPDSPAIAEFTEQVVMEIRRLAREGELAQIETVYLGGGTPSYLGTRYLTQIMYALSLSMHFDGVECSMEANPDSLDERLVRDVWALGVNRISIGVQSFDDDLLRLLGRVHDADAARRAIEVAHTRFENVSVDLMCGIPGQTGEGFRADLQTALDAGVTHVSVYPLTIEPGTEFAKMVRKKKMPDVSEDDEAMFMSMAASVLEPAGMPRYEVASYARPGFECRHNTMYWVGVPYIGIGPSAVTMTQDATHRMRVQDGRVVEELDRRQMAAEDTMLKMRMSRGISDAEAAEASLLLPALPATLQRLLRDNLLVHEDGRWKPTRDGWLYGNMVYEAIYELA